MRKIKAGVAGYGRSGNYHHVGSYLKLSDKYEIVALFETDETRRKEAEEKLKCRVYKDYDSFLKDTELELVSIATPSYLHPEHTIRAFEAGKHVVCEKPISDKVTDVDEMIKAAEKNKKVFAPFQNRRLDPLFQKILEVTNSGILGKLIEVKISWQGFSRKWDWQVIKKYKGGTLNNSGPHIIDWGLQFMPEEEYKMFCQLDKTLTCGDTDDHVKIILKSDNSPLLDLEISSCAAYKHSENFLIMGTKGGVRATNEEVWWKYCNPENLPERVLPQIAKSEERKYCSEDIEWTENHWKVPKDAIFWSVTFYSLLHKTLTEGAPLFITPESARRVVKVIEECHKISGI